MGTLRVLMVDDSELDTELLVGHFEANDYDVKWRRVDTAEDLRDAIQTGDWDIALCDYVMPRLNGASLTRIARASRALE